jgi:hypothetical protein
LNHQFRIPHVSRKTVLLIVGVAAITLSLNMLISMRLSRWHNFEFASSGFIHTVSVEAFGGDMINNSGAQYIDWGTIYLGTSVNRSLYIRNKSNIPTTLALAPENWTFTNENGQNAPQPNSTYMALAWNYSNAQLNPQDVIPVTLTLNVSGDNAFIDYLVNNRVIGFSFDIHILPAKT